MRKLVTLFFTVMLLSGMVCLSDTGAAEWVHVSGEVTSDYGTPLCAMVLANGQHMFTCGGDLGLYDLNVPPDENGAVTLLAFCDGLAPFKETLYPGGTGQVYDITMIADSGNSPRIAVICQMQTASEHPGWVKITGEVRTEPRCVPWCWQTDSIRLPATARENSDWKFRPIPEGKSRCLFSAKVSRLSDRL